MHYTLAHVFITIMYSNKILVHYVVNTYMCIYMCTQNNAMYKYVDAMRTNEALCGVVHHSELESVLPLVTVGQGLAEVVRWQC